jgi:hypothetical protein
LNPKRGAGPLSLSQKRNLDAKEIADPRRAVIASMARLLRGIRYRIFFMSKLKNMQRRPRRLPIFMYGLLFELTSIGAPETSRSYEIIIIYRHLSPLSHLSSLISSINFAYVLSGISFLSILLMIPPGQLIITLSEKVNESSDTMRHGGVVEGQAVTAIIKTDTIKNCIFDQSQKAS